ncbi:hypothetical protein TNCV_1229011 [Trichonephila clavipes]|nr:hypothetical protein TNCV_1229011 [Trichonephila clavipes]
MGYEISLQIRDGILKWEIVNPDDSNQNNGTKLLSYCIVIGPGHQVSAPCHTVKYLKGWYHSKIIESFSRPGNSPDLNPIEHLQHRLKTLVRMRYL